MSRRLRISSPILVTLCLCALVAAAASEPAKIAAPAPQASAGSPAPAAIPDWLKPAETKSLLEPAGRDPSSPVFLTSCPVQCRAIESQCIDCCNGDSSCMQQCGNDYLCCLGSCLGNNNCP